MESENSPQNGILSATDGFKTDVPATSKSQFTIPSVVHFLQHEWARFERERSNWDVERAELKARIAFLQGERKGQETLKRDLVRRIKMLEYALRQERAKAHRSKNLSGPPNESEPSPKVRREANDQAERDRRRFATAQIVDDQQAMLRQGRQLLQQYLQEVGYTDSLISVRSGRVRSLLNMGGGGSDGTNQAFQFGSVPMSIPSTPLVHRPHESNVREAQSSSVTIAKGKGISPTSSSPDAGEEESLPRLASEKVVHTSSVKVTLQSRAVPAKNAPSSPTKPSSPTRVDELDPIQATDAAANDGDDDDDDDDDDEESIVASFNFLEGLDDGGDDDNQNDANEKESAGTVLDDDTVAAMAEFDFLETEDFDEDSSKAVVNEDEGSYPESAQEVLADSGHANDAKSRLEQLKEKYKEDRKNKNKKKSSHRPARSELREMMKTLSGEDSAGLPASLQAAEVQHRREESAVGGSSEKPPPPSLPPPLLLSGGAAAADEVDLQGMSMRMPGSKGKRSKVAGIDNRSDLLLGKVETLTASLGLGDLAGLSLTNEAEPLFNASGSSSTDSKKVWSPRFSLQSHFDGVRSLAFHPQNTLLVTASEDSTLKLWNVQKPLHAKKSTLFDLEPLYTFRGHSDPVWCCSMSRCGRYVFSGSSDTTICRWLLPSEDCDPFGPYGSCHELTDDFRVVMKGHTDSVWGLASVGPSQSDEVVASCSADGTCRLWKPAESAQPLATIVATEGQPTSIDAVPTEPNHCVLGHSSGRAVVLDVERQQPVVTCDGSSDLPGLQQINRIASHPTLPITITAHEDRHMRFFDNKSGEQIHSMVAHMEGVTCVSVDPNGLFLVSGSHDCSLRVWNYETKTCVQEMTSHRKKFEESICDVTFHGAKPMIASAGADAIVKVFM